MRLYYQTESAPQELKWKTHIRTLVGGTGRSTRRRMHLDGHDHGANGPETFLAERILHASVAAEPPWIVRNFEQQCRRG